jgi:hypothetical protein
MENWTLDIDEYCEGSILLDGLESAIIGVVNTFEGNRILYSKQKIYDILQERDGMTQSEAEDFFDYNIIGGYFGELNPVFLDLSVSPVENGGKWEFKICS